MNQPVMNGYAEDPGLTRMQLAQAYFLFQKFEGLLSPDQALDAGTVFPEFLGRKYADPPSKEGVEQDE